MRSDELGIFLELLVSTISGFFLLTRKNQRVTH